MAPEKNGSSSGAAREEAPVKVPAKDPKKKEEKKDEDLVSALLALRFWFLSLCSI